MEGHLRLTDQSHCFHQIYLIPQILLKSRLLIGRELQMLASDWSEGQLKMIKGVPLYDMEGHLRLTVNLICP